MSNLGHGVIEKVLLFDDHRSSNKDIAISTTTVIGSNWKAQRAMRKDVIKKLEVDPMMRRSSTIGTGFHMRAEQALRSDSMVTEQELYAERELDGVWISGTFDLIYNNHIMDWKTSYGKAFSQEKINKAILQMSIYRWLHPEIHIKNLAYTLFVSQSNNAYDSYPTEIMDEFDTEKYLKERIRAIKYQDKIDCHEGVKYNPCNYCEFSEQGCKDLVQANAGDFS